MTRAELKESVSELPFEYVCKIKGNKNHLRYHYINSSAYWYLLTVDYNDNSCSLSGHGNWPNERIERKFDNMCVHSLTQNEFASIFKMFIK